MSGIATPNLSASDAVDDLIGNYQGNTVRVTLERLAAVVAALMGPTYQTRAQLFADLDWPSLAIGYVRGDGNAAFNGVYKKSGASGTGSWARIGDLPSGALEAAAISQLRSDLQTWGTRFYETRDAAVAHLPVIDQALIRRVVTIEGRSLIVRGPGQTTDDPLFAAYPNWGVVTRLNSADTIRDAGVIPLTNVGGTANAITATLLPSMVTNGVTLGGQSTVELVPAAANTGDVTLSIDGSAPSAVRDADGGPLPTGALVPGRSYLLRRRNTSWRLISGDVALPDLAVLRTDLHARRVASSWVADFSTTTFPAGVDTILQRQVNSWSIWILQPAPGDPASNYQQDAQGQWWMRVGSSTDIAVNAAKTLAAGHIRLTNVAGTPDAITADLPPEFAATPVAAGRWLAFTPLVANAGSGPTLVIGAEGPRTLRDENGVTLPPARLVPGVLHFLWIETWQFARVMGIAASVNEMARLRAAAERTEAIVAPVQAVVQETASLPARPKARVVHWHSWTDPTALMAGPDLWVQLPEPSIPAAPLPGEWELLNARTGDALVARLSAIPDTIPPLTAVEYRVNGGAWVRVNGVKRGDDLVIGNLGIGQATSVDLRYRNFVGAGPASAARSATPATGDFSDNFNRADGPLSGDPRWRDFLTGGSNRRLSILANQAQGSGTNEDYGCYIAGEYFPPDQFAQMRVVSTGTMTGLPRGLFLWVRSQIPAARTGYQLRISGTEWVVNRFRDGSDLILARGTLSGAQLPGVARLSAVGDVITATLGGTVLATVTDASPEKLGAGGVAVSMHNGASDGAGAIRFDDFVAGRAV